MKYNLPTKNFAGWNSFSNLKENYWSAIENLLLLTSISPHSRLEKYKNELNILASFEDSRLAGESIVNDPKLRSAFIESHQIIQVSNFLSDYLQTNELSEKNIQKLQGGVYNYAESRSSDPSRDIFFEFLTASHLSDIGIAVDLSSITDIIAQFKDYKIFIECKRVTSEAQYKSRIKEGIKQLNKRFTKGKTKEFGLVFISITSILNPDLNAIKASNILEINYNSEKLCKEFVNKNIGEWLPTEKKVLAVYNHLTAPYFDQQIESVCFRTFHFFNSFFGVNLDGNPLYTRSFPRNNYFDIFTDFDTTFGKKTNF